MSSTFKARYANGALTPLEPLDLAEGAEVTVSIAGAAAGERGGMPGIIDFVKELHESIPPDAWGVLPTDGARNYKHYRYGRPREQHDARPASGEVLDEIEAAEELRKSMPPDAWDDVPTDLAENYKHYLYGHPKDEDREGERR